VAQPAQPRENNNTFEHFGETGGDLKLTIFPEKSVGPNSSTPAPRIAWLEGGVGHCSFLSSSPDHFREPTYSNKLTLTAVPSFLFPPMKSLDLNTLSGVLQTSLVERGTIDYHKAQHIYTKEGQRL
jgi:hypothetical protein